MKAPQWRSLGERWGGSRGTRSDLDTQAGTPSLSQHHHPSHPHSSACLISTLAQIPASCPPPPGSLTSVPPSHHSPEFPSVTTSATYPVSPPLCQWPPPQSRLTCPPGQFPNRDPRPGPSACLPLGSPAPQRGWAKRELVSVPQGAPIRCTPLPFTWSPRRPASLRPPCEGPGWKAQACVVLTCGEWRSRPM